MDLAVPGRLAPQVMVKWGKLRTRMGNRGVRLVLWDENELCDQLAKPEAVAIRREYYILISPVAPVREIRPRRHGFEWVDTRQTAEFLDANASTHEFGPSVRVITGMAGSGKSSLARQLCHMRGQDWTVLWLDASSPPVLLHSLRSACEAWGLPEGGGVEALYYQLGRRTSWLLVFDAMPAPDELTGLPAPFETVLDLVVLTTDVRYGVPARR